MARIALSAAIVLALILLGCQTTEEYLRSFHGKPRSYLLGRLGPPDIKEPDDRGGEIWIYQERDLDAPTTTKTTDETEHDSSDSTRETTIRHTSPRERVINKSFFIDPEGIIYDSAHGSRYIRR